ncbi:MAG: nucleotide exchange factor GrpE [Ruminococcus sp.]
MEENEKNPDVQEDISENPAEDNTDQNDNSNECDDISAKISELESKLNDSEDKYLRLFAEYDNFRKRTSKEKIEAFGNATAKCVENILPVIDSFERAIIAECSDEAYKNGMTMIFNQFKSVLDKLDVKEVPALGEDFDPNLHNAVTKVDSEDFESGKICQVYQKGYKIGDRLIRPAMVVVAN